MEKTKELFDQRNKIKQNIEISIKKRQLMLHSGQIWRYYCGVNISKEISKHNPFKRPCLIISSHMGYDMVGILPILGQKPSIANKFYHEICNRQNYGLSKPSYALFNQFKVISTHRLTQKINDNGKYKLLPIYEIKQKLKSLL